MDRKIILVVALFLIINVNFISAELFGYNLLEEDSTVVGGIWTNVSGTATYFGDVNFTGLIYGNGSQLTGINGSGGGGGSGIWTNVSGTATYFDNVNISGGNLNIQPTGGSLPGLTIDGSDTWSGALQDYSLSIGTHQGGTKHVQITTDDDNSRMTIIAADKGDSAPRLSFVGPQDAVAGVRGFLLFDYGSNVFDLPAAAFKLRHYEMGGSIFMMESIGRDYVRFPNSPVGFGTATTPTAQAEIGISGTTVTGLQIDGISSQSSDYISVFDDSLSEILEVDSDGFFGLNTDPDRIIDVVGNNSNAKSVQLRLTDVGPSSSGSGTGFVMANDDGAVLLDGDRIGFMLFGGWKSTASGIENAAGISAYASENWIDDTSHGAKFQFETNNKGTTTRTTKLIIDDNVNVTGGNLNVVNNLTVGGTITGDPITGSMRKDDNIKQDVNALTIGTGSISSGGISNLTKADGVYLVLNEVGGAPGFNYSFNFSLNGGNPSLVTIFGSYDGNIAHTIKVRMENITGSFEDLTCDPNDITDTFPTDVLYECMVDGNRSRFNLGGSANVRIVHTSSGNVNHDLYLDLMNLKISSVDLPTAGEWVKLTDWDAVGVENNIDVNITNGNITVLYDGFYDVGFHCSIIGLEESIIEIAAWINGVETEFVEAKTHFISASSLNTIGAENPLNLNTGDTIDLRFECDLPNCYAGVETCALKANRLN